MLCEVDSNGEEGLFGLREVRDISDEEAAAAFSSDEEEGGAKDLGVFTCWPPPATAAPGPLMCGAAWAPERSGSRS